MKKINLLLVLIAFGHHMLFAQCIDITPLFLEGTEDYGSQVTSFLEEDNGDFVVLWKDKIQPSPNTSSKVMLTKIDEMGTLIWEREFDLQGEDSPGNLLKAPDGGYIFGLARSEGPNFTDSFVIKTDVNGIEEWNTMLETQAYGQNSARGVLLDDQGNILVYGLAQSLSGCSGYVFRVTQLSPEGEENWTNCYNESQWRAIKPIYLESTQEYLFGVTINEGMRVIKLNLNGEISYDVNYLPQELEGTGEDLRGEFIKGTGDDYLLISGNPDDCFSSSIIKFNAEHEVEWEIINSCTEDYANKARLLDDGTWLLQMWDGAGSYFQRLSAAGEVLSTSAIVEDRWISAFSISSSNDIVYAGRNGVVDDSDAILEHFTCAELTESTIIQPTSCEIPEFLPLDGLVAYYPFCGNAEDLSGNDLTAIINGAVFSQNREGEAENAMYFDGEDDYLRVLHNPLLEFSDENAVSISYWVNLDSYPPGSDVDIIFSKQSGSGNTQTGWNVNQNSLITQALTVGNSGNLEGIGVGLLPLDTWFHVTFTRDDNTRRAYLDGLLIDEQIVSTPIGSNEMDLLIGKANWNNVNAQHFNGTLDDIAIYNRALTQTEVEAIYNEETPPLCDPCLANYMKGDFNCDGSVSTDDLLVFLVNFGTSIEP